MTDRPWLQPAGFVARSLAWLVLKQERIQFIILLATLYGMVDLYGIKKTIALINRARKAQKNHGKPIAKQSKPQPDTATAGTSTNRENRSVS